MIEKETKFAVDDIASVSEKLSKIAEFLSCEYIRDTIYNLDEARLRLRVKSNFKNVSVEAMFKHRVGGGSGIKVEVEEIVYAGDSVKEAIKKIMSLGNFVKYNSYEKIRVNYEVHKPHAHIALDIYPYGAWVEIEAEEENIWKVAETFGFKKDSAIDKNADELYEEWCQKNNTDVLWDVRFGFPFVKDNIYRKAGSDISEKTERG